MYFANDLELSGKKLIEDMIGTPKPNTLCKTVNIIEDASQQIAFSFYLIPSNEKRPTLALIDLICGAGGRISETADDPHTIKILNDLVFVVDPKVDMDLPPDTYSSRFIYDSIKLIRNGFPLPDLGKYLITPSIYKTYDAMEILTGNLAWSSLEKVDDPNAIPVVRAQHVARLTFEDFENTFSSNENDTKFVHSIKPGSKLTSASSSFSKSNDNLNEESLQLQVFPAQNVPVLEQPTSQKIVEPGTNEEDDLQVGKLNKEHLEASSSPLETTQAEKSSCRKIPLEFRDIAGPSERKCKRKMDEQLEASSSPLETTQAEKSSCRKIPLEFRDIAGPSERKCKRKMDEQLEASSSPLETTQAEKSSCRKIPLEFRDIAGPSERKCKRKMDEQLEASSSSLETAQAKKSSFCTKTPIEFRDIAEPSKGKIAVQSRAKTEDGLINFGPDNSEKKVGSTDDEDDDDSGERHPYSKEEDQMIIDIICETKSFSKTGGRTLFKSMANDKRFQGKRKRTTYSLENRWKRTLKRKILNDEKKFRSEINISDEHWDQLITGVKKTKLFPRTSSYQEN